MASRKHCLRTIIIIGSVNIALWFILPSWLASVGIWVTETCPEDSFDKVQIISELRQISTKMKRNDFTDIEKQMDHIFQLLDSSFIPYDTAENIQHSTKKDVNGKSVSSVATKPVTKQKAISKATTKTTSKATVQNNNVVVDICPDEFLGPNYGEPYFLNGSWVPIKNCKSEKSVHKLVTIVLLRRGEGTESCSSATKSLIHGIQKTYPGILVVLGSDSSKCVQEKHLEIVYFGETSMTDGEAWNKLTEFVTTPYMLIGKDITLFSWFSQLKRLVRVISVNPSVVIAGGSFRNASGHWHVGCYQTEIRMYQFQYKEGYYHSENECMFCDYITGPFVQKTKLMDIIQFDKKLPPEVLFEDYFKRIKSLKSKVLTCPDAMFFVDTFDFSKKLENRTVWLPFVKKWEFNELYFEKLRFMKYDCKESGSSCYRLLQSSGKRGMPICCREQIVNALKVIQKINVEAGLYYYLNGGTLLGAIKFGDIIPWDFDGDIIYYFSNMTYYKNISNKYSSKSGVHFDEYNKKHPGYFQVKTPDTFIEMAALNVTAIDVLEMSDYFRKVPTLVKIGTTWVYGPPSPGLYIRFLYGKEYLRHSNGWWNKGHYWYDAYKEQAKFYKCDKPNHHSCNDNYPTDGSLPFYIT